MPTLYSRLRQSNRELAYERAVAKISARARRDLAPAIARLRELGEDQEHLTRALCAAGLVGGLGGDRWAVARVSAKALLAPVEENLVPRRIRWALEPPGRRYQRDPGAIRPDSPIYARRIVAIATDHATACARAAELAGTGEGLRLEDVDRRVGEVAGEFGEVLRAIVERDGAGFFWREATKVELEDELVGLVTDALMFCRRVWTPYRKVFGEWLRARKGSEFEQSASPRNSG